MPGAISMFPHQFRRSRPLPTLIRPLPGVGGLISDDAGGYCPVGASVASAPVKLCGYDAEIRSPVSRPPDTEIATLGSRLPEPAFSKTASVTAGPTQGTGSDVTCSRE